MAPSKPIDVSEHTVISRGDLFPASVAIPHGLDPATNSFYTIEAPSTGSCTSLYGTLLLYAAQFAVDLDEPLPNPGELKDSKCVYPEKEAERVKNIKPEFQPFLEPCSRDGKTVMTKRQGVGRLSSLWTCPGDELENFESSSSDDDDNDSEANDSDEDGHAEPRQVEDDVTFGLRRRRPPPVQRWQMGLGYAKLSFEFGSNAPSKPLNSNGEQAKPDSQQKQKQAEEDAEETQNDKSKHVILIRHVAFSPPLANYDEFCLFRTLVLAGPSADVLRAFCAYVTKWKADRAEVGLRTRPGTFTLFRYKLYGSNNGSWEKQRRKRGRSRQSVILKDRMLDSIVADVRDFCARDTKAWYELHGIPHRRSLLFHGPPGTGKTSTIKMLAGMFRLNACFLSFTSPDFSNQSLHDALSTLPGRALLVLEDVDVLFNEERKAESSSSVTFSGLLNAIDGIVSVDGIISIFTTNHIEKLDKALIRGGRVDRRFEFVHPNGAHMAQVFKSFYPDASDELAKEFANEILNRKEDESKSISTMQQHFIYTRRLTARQCIDKIPEFFKEFYADGVKSRSSIYI